ncbi:hypothetical protein G3M53_03895, partial [Streptomyces sp. SID7982]|nr:hypothetical protein [Streptomyces sp. SID7982]
MRDINRRGLLGAGLGAAAAIGLAGCGTSGSSGDGGSGRGGKGDAGTGGNGSGNGSPKNKVRLIGDGSTADTGKQPHQPEAPVPLEPGQKPPQFVIFSWDGAGEVGNGLFPRFLELAKEHDAAMTFFLSGLYLLPESKKSLYRPP